MKNTLAIYGGSPVFSPGEIKNWPPIDKIDELYVLDALHAAVQSRGTHNLAFEEEFKAWNGNKFALLTNSGTAALHMCIAACGISAGDHVLVTAYSWVSSATCILHHGAIPVFVDIDPETFLIDAGKIEAAITPRTKAIMVVQLHGLCADMDEINAIARRHNLFVIEDACQAHGSTYRGRKAGTLGHCAAFSLNQFKCLSAGEGGTFVTDDETLYNNAAKFWSFGETARPEQTRDHHAYALGWMYRNNELTAAFARAQLTKLDGYLAVLRENSDYLRANLNDNPMLKLPYEPAECHHTYYNFNLRINFEAAEIPDNHRIRVRFRDAVCAALNAEGLPCNVWQHYILPEMTVFQARNAFGGGYPWSIPGADEGVDYNPAQFPAAREYCDCHIAIVTTLRAPNTTVVAGHCADAINKVFEQLDQIDPERILKG